MAAAVVGGKDPVVGAPVEALMVHVAVASVAAAVVVVVAVVAASRRDFHPLEALGRAAD